MTGGRVGSVLSVLNSREVRQRAGGADGDSGRRTPSPRQLPAQRDSGTSARSVNRAGHLLTDRGEDHRYCRCLRCEGVGDRPLLRRWRLGGRAGLRSGNARQVLKPPVAPRPVSRPGTEVQFPSGLPVSSVFYGSLAGRAECSGTNSTVRSAGPCEPPELQAPSRNLPPAGAYWPVQPFLHGRDRAGSDLPGDSS